MPTGRRPKTRGHTDKRLVYPNAQTIIDCRKRLHLTAEEFAKEAVLDKETIGKIENWNQCFPRSLQHIKSAINRLVEEHNQRERKKQKQAQIEGTYANYVSQTTSDYIHLKVEMEDLIIERSAREKLQRQLTQSCLYGLLTPVNNLNWAWLYPPQESGLLTEAPTVPKYVARTIDNDFRGAIREALSTKVSRYRLIVVSGVSKAGKTRTLLEALKTCCGKAKLLWVRPSDRSQEKPPFLVLVDEWERATSWGVLPLSRVVVVLDDLQYHLSVHTNAITYPALSFLAQQANVLIVATCQPGFLRLDSTKRNKRALQPDPELVRWVNERAIRLEAKLDEEERLKALETFAKALEEKRMTPASLLHLAETLASVDQLVARYDAAAEAAADTKDARGAALVKAAIDHWVLLPGFAVAAEGLAEFTARHFQDRFPTRGWRKEYTQDAIGWATEALGQVHAILQEATVKGSPVLRLHDGVAARLAEKWIVPNWLHEYKDRLPQVAQLNVGLFLEGRNRSGEAENWFRRVSASGDPEAMNLLAGFLDRRGDTTSAMSLYENAAGAGSVAGMMNLASLLKRRGADEEAERWYRRAADAGVSDAIASLGELVEKRGEEAEAEKLYLRAAEAGSDEAMCRLGMLYERRGDTAKSQSWLSRSVEAGNPVALLIEGHRLNDQGDLVSAETLFRNADERGSPIGALYTGLSLLKRGDLEGAERAWRRAEARGSADAACELGLLLEQRGERAGAEAAYWRADKLGSPFAPVRLGFVLMERADLKGAEAAWRRGDERGSAGGAVCLALLLRDHGDPEGAEAAYQRADESSDTMTAGVLSYHNAETRYRAMAAYALGCILFERNDHRGAEAVFRRADERGSAEGAYNLGVLLQGRGDIGGAEAAFCRAAERGFTGEG